MQGNFIKILHKIPENRFSSKVNKNQHLNLLAISKRVNCSRNSCYFCLIASRGEKANQVVHMLNGCTRCLFVWHVVGKLALTSPGFTQQLIQSTGITRNYIFTHSLICIIKNMLCIMPSNTFCAWKSECRAVAHKNGIIIQIICHQISGIQNVVLCYKLMLVVWHVGGSFRVKRGLLDFFFENLIFIISFVLFKDLWITFVFALREAKTWKWYCGNSENLIKNLPIKNYPK